MVRNPHVICKVFTVLTYLQRNDLHRAGFSGTGEKNPLRAMGSSLLSPKTQGLQAQGFSFGAVEQIGIEEDTLEDGGAHGNEAFVLAVEHDDGFVSIVYGGDKGFRFGGVAQIDGLHGTFLSFSVSTSRC